MKPKTAVDRQELFIQAPAARIETVVEVPDGVWHGLALIAHPHPLSGGTLDNKVAHTLARAALARNYVAVRPNFRGAGRSTGEHNQGLGETEDLLAVATEISPRFGDLPWTLLGFSFGAYVQHRLAQLLGSHGLEARQLILVGAAVSMYTFDPPALPTTLIHGAEDELIPLAAVREYADRYDIPLHVLAGAGHFFHGKLVELRTRVEKLLT